MSDKEKAKKDFVEILMYIFGAIFITSFFWLFFISAEFGEINIKISAVVFICSSVACYILACILAEKYKKNNLCQP